MTRWLVPLVLLLSGGCIPQLAFGAIFPFPRNAQWLNVSSPLTLSELRGRVVLLDFFTPGCINCIHMLPVERELKHRFGPRLVIIDVDSPKFAASRHRAAVRDFVLRYQVEDPVLIDPKMKLWNAYGVFAWPTFVLLNPNGGVTERLIGEQSLSALSTAVRSALGDVTHLPQMTPLPLHPVTGGKRLLSAPGGLAISGNRVAIADTAHNRILIANRHGQITAVYGDGTAGHRNGKGRHAQFDRPHGLVFDGNRLFVADTASEMIRVINLRTDRVSTVAGNGSRRFLTHGHYSARQAPLNSPWGLALKHQQLYIGMAGDHQVWKLNLTKKSISPWAGTGREGLADGPIKEAEFAQTSGLTIGPNRLYTADPESSAIRVIGLENRQVLTLAGQGLFVFGHRDGKAEHALFQHPEGLVLDQQNHTLYIADTFNDDLRSLVLPTRTVHTIATNLHQPQAVALWSNTRLLVAESAANRLVLVNIKSGSTKQFRLLQPFVTHAHHR